MLLTVSERYKTEKLPYDTHTPPPKLEFLNWSDFLGNLKLGKYSKFPGIFYIRGKGQFDESVY